MAQKSFFERFFFFKISMLSYLLYILEYKFSYNTEFHTVHGETFMALRFDTPYF